MDSEGATLDALPQRVLSRDQWLELERRHREIVTPWIEAFRDRRARRVTHPVHDFLFTYYQTNRQVLERWRPSAAMALEGREAEIFLEDDRYRTSHLGVCLDPGKMDDGSLQRTRWARSLISAAKTRPPRFNCFGLHEWAMVYRAKEIRHEKTPLRLSPDEVARTVESNPIRCSHFDAFRFFTKEAAPLNQLQPGKDDRLSNEQFGCVHFNMDLYRLSYKLSPWVGSDLIRDCFLLALEARELDMRASPYDLSGYGYAPILIETTAGREEYAREQQRIHLAGQPLADRLFRECAFLLAAVEGTRGSSSGESA